MWLGNTAIRARFITSEGALNHPLGRFVFPIWSPRLSQIKIESPLKLVANGAIAFIPSVPAKDYCCKQETSKAMASSQDVCSFRIKIFQHT